MSPDPDPALRTGNHWGLGRPVLRDGRLVEVRPHPADPWPSALNGNIAGSLGGRARILRPAIRVGWLENGPGPADGARGREPFVEVDWDTALDRLAEELGRVRAAHGNGAIYAGSYGWGSAGRFHHPQTQLKRFLNAVGGFVRSEGNYSYNAALVLLPHVVGNYRDHVKQATRLSNIARHGELVVMFGGFPLRNTQVSDGGLGRHRIQGALRDCAANGVRFVNVSPLKGDADPVLNAEWIAPRPGTDVALMMGLAQTLIAEGLHDRAFLDRYTVGFDRVAAYLAGQVDGVAKTADWAESQCGVPADRIRDLAREMAGKRTMISCAAALQRADWGEQPLWMTVALAALLGQIGLPGGGYTIGYGVNASVGVMDRILRPGALPQGENPIADYIPVAMVSDMLLTPGGAYDYNGERRRLPDIRMVWWAGGNPFHHHQNLNRLRAAFQRPETVVVNDFNWTATARHADIVLPVAAPEERRDFVCGKQDNALIPSPALVAPPGQARTEYEIFSDLADRLGARDAFTEGRGEEDWLRDMWARTVQTAAGHGIALPDWGRFMASGPIELPDPAPDRVFLSEFRADPDANPLPTPSGKIELYSEVIAGFGYDDCPGHPVWMPPRGVADGTARRFPLALLSGQPEARLHSQMDNGGYSLSQKIAGREPVLIHPADAAAHGIADGDVVELFNDRGRCLAGARVTDAIAPGVVFLRTGAWYDPDPDDPQARDRHGNPNVLTHDLRTSRLSQGPAAQSAFVEIRRHDGPAPAVMAHEPPAFA
ncbi:molybdopterin-dependent oxidoreductase [Jhaorihella thermophila]|uniref:Biotin/methionine sulfoxide reductase n=1 Tax=Jhaorihella thermophila TaxID=488547 RepID=A0A1H5S1B8_9RHOB|nr:molybdopterin-dependent oxidoreductase [Jhaorihella thermophila]SEF44396.1 biotin/methionine sulfoxide reductase [Jhaorihella thermophila]